MTSKVICEVRFELNGLNYLCSHAFLAFKSFPEMIETDYGRGQLWSIELRSFARNKKTTCEPAVHVRALSECGNEILPPWYRRIKWQFLFLTTQWCEWSLYRSLPLPLLSNPEVVTIVTMAHSHYSADSQSFLFYFGRKNHRVFEQLVFWLHKSQ